MTSDSKPPREFDLHCYHSHIQARGRDPKNPVVYSQGEVIHVIEYSAYEVLKAELASVKKHYEKMFDDLLHSKGNK